MTGNESTRIYDSGKCVTFHFQKKTPELNEKWIRFINRCESSASSSSVVSELHFEERLIAQGVRDRLEWDLSPIRLFIPKQYSNGHRYSQRLLHV